MTVGDRIKKLRRDLDLTQREFGDRIGVKPNTISTYEIGRNEPIDSVISLICREFHVNEAWLRNGTGEIFQTKPSNALDALAEERNMSVGTYVLIEKILNLKPEMQEAFVNLALDIAATINRLNLPVTDPLIRQKIQASGLSPAGLSAPAAQAPDSHERKDQPAAAQRPEDWTREEIHRRIDEHFDLLEKAEASSEAS